MQSQLPLKGEQRDFDVKQVDICSHYLFIDKLVTVFTVDVKQEIAHLETYNSVCIFKANKMCNRHVIIHASFIMFWNLGIKFDIKVTLSAQGHLSVKIKNAVPAKRLHILSFLVYPLLES